MDRQDILKAIDKAFQTRYNFYFDSKFNKEEAITVCNHKIPFPRHYNPPSCFTCYYFDGKCTIHENEDIICEDYRDDVFCSNLVHKNLLKDYGWCKKNLDWFCQTDKELFFALHGERYHKELHDSLCGNCKCYSPYQFHCETGRCRKYNITVQLSTHCIKGNDWECKCQFKENGECMEYREHKENTE